MPVYTDGQMIHGLIARQAFGSPAFQPGTFVRTMAPPFSMRSKLGSRPWATNASRKCFSASFNSKKRTERAGFDLGWIMRERTRGTGRAQQV
jgi:hypothetical protein